jgi:hypothetical protein
VVDRITELSTDRPIVEEDGTLTIQSRTYFKTITAQALIIGDGSPEGVVEAEIGATYQDNLGTAGAIRYAKRDADILGDKSKGWILI